MKVLLVNDEQIQLMMMKHVIELLNSFKTVDCAKSGLEALEMSKNQRYDLIILDLNMPIMDGYESAPLIKEFH